MFEGTLAIGAQLKSKLNPSGGSAPKWPVGGSVRASCGSLLPSENTCR